MARTRQPQGVARINWSNSLTRGLVFEQTGQINPPLSKSGVLLAVDDGLLTARYTKASSTYALRTGLNIASYPLTIAVRVRSLTTPTTGNAQILFNLSRSDNTALQELYLGDNGINILALSYNAGTSSQASISYTHSTSSYYNAAGIFVASNSRFVYLNGSLSSADTANVSISNPVTSAYLGVEALAGSRSAATYFDGYMPHCAVWARALSVAELDNYYRNPWQLFAPSRRIWVQLGAAAGGGTDTTVAPSKGALVATGYAPTVARQANQTVAPTLGHAVIAGRTPGVSQTVVTTVAPTLAHATITGRQPGVVRTDNQAVAPSLARATVTGRAPGIEQDIGVAPTIAHLTATGRQPGITQNVTSFIAPSKGALTATGKQPAVQQTASQTIAPSKGVAYLAGYAPVVEIAGGSQILLPSKGVLTLTGYAPEVSTGGELGGKPVFARRRKRYLVKDRVYDDLDPADVIAAAKEAGVDLGDVREVVKEPTAQKSRPRRADDDGREYWLPQEFWGRAAARQKLEATAPLGEDFQRAVEALRASAGPLQARMALRRRQEEEAIILLMA
jgi:hypothetical protein